jgi:hypothetical protein
MNGLPTAKMPCDFFVWGWVKEQVYYTKPRNLEEVEERISSVLTSIPGNILRSAVVNVPV